MGPHTRAHLSWVCAQLIRTWLAPSPTCTAVLECSLGAPAIAIADLQAAYSAVPQMASNEYLRQAWRPVFLALQASWISEGLAYEPVGG